ncbi:MAG: hypothetical protein V4612_02715 [Pseudomonadota bacterium]
MKHLSIEQLDLFFDSVVDIFESVFDLNVNKESASAILELIVDSIAPKGLTAAEDFQIKLKSVLEQHQLESILPEINSLNELSIHGVLKEYPSRHKLYRSFLMVGNAPHQCYKELFAFNHLLNKNITNYIEQSKPKIDNLPEMKNDIIALLNSSKESFVQNEESKEVVRQ